MNRNKILECILYMKNIFKDKISIMSMNSSLTKMAYGHI
jgi:hypothetical protein